MSNKYSLMRLDQTGRSIEIAVIETAKWPKDMASFLGKHGDEYVFHYMESCKVALFPVTLSQSEAQATARARAYCAHINDLQKALDVTEDKLGLSVNA